jgi:hypothetical protein
MIMYRKYLIFVIMSFVYVALIYSLSFTVDIFAVPPDNDSLLLETFKELDYKISLETIPIMLMLFVTM